jgi:hypothetical protein
VKLTAAVEAGEEEQAPIEGGLAEEAEDAGSARTEAPVEGVITPIVGGAGDEMSDKSRLAVVLFALLLGSVGGHRFYLEKVSTAVVSLILGVLGWVSLLTRVISGVSESTNVWMAFGTIALIFVVVWSMIDFILALAGITRDRRGRPVRRW